MLHPRVLTILGLTAAVLFLLGIAADVYTLRLAVKPWLVLALAAGVWGRGERPIATPVTLGLVLSAAGDLLLEISDATFLYGIAAFLLAHLAYIAAFVGEAPRLRPVRAVPFAIWGAGLLWWLKDGLEAAAMLIPVAIYTLVICTMMWRAAVWLGEGAHGARLAFAGALLFAASDSAIAIDRFGDGEPIPGVRYLIIVLYWLGQTGIASSTSGRGSERGPAA